MKFETILETIGLDPTESAVYLASLKLGTQDPAHLAKAVGLSRYDTITTLSRLTQKGFMSKCAIGKGFFTAELPSSVLKIVEEKNGKSSKPARLLKQALPHFDNFRNPLYTRPEITFFEGKEGIIAAYEDTLTAKTDILAIASIDDTEKLFPRYVPTYYKRRKAAGIFIKAIFPDTKRAKMRQTQDQEQLRESRLVPANKYNFGLEINIYDDKVAYFSMKENLAILIKSADIAENMRNMFQLCWSMAKIYEES